MPSFLPEPVRFMICGALEAEYKKLKASVDGFLRALMEDISSIEVGLGFINNPLDDIMDGLKDMLGLLDDAVPDLSDADSIQAIMDFISACTYLKDHSRFSNAYNLMKSMYDQYMDKADDFLSQWNTPAGADFKLEINLGSQMNDYIEKLLAFQFPQKSKDLQAILACIEAICALDEADNPIQEIVDSVNAKKNALTDVFNDTRTKADGSFDKDKVFDNAGLTTEKKFGMSKSMDALAKVKDTFKEAHANAVAATKGDPKPFPETEVLTHLNDPSFISTSVDYDEIDPDLEYEDEFLETWNTLEEPIGTTTKKGDLDTIVEIASCDLTETPDPKVNCYAVYKVLVNIIIGFRESFKITQTHVNDSNNPAVVKHYDHGMVSEQIISISDSTHGFDGDFEITVVDTDTFTFVCSATIGEELGVKISLLKSSEAEIAVGTPICGDCFKYTTFGLNACNDTQKSFIRKHLAKVIKEAMVDAMKEYTAEDIIGQLL